MKTKPIIGRTATFNPRNLYRLPTSVSVSCNSATILAGIEPEFSPILENRIRSEGDIFFHGKYILIQISNCNLYDENI
ncbi:MAG: hypothetical protein IPN26_10855 [Bacteroidetes bacterium]|nr:hypothetical protein [Bacteroidota bacterium]